MTDPRPLRRAATITATLRPMVPADLEAVLALERELFPDDAWTPEMFAHEVSQPTDSRLYLVAEAALVQGSALPSGGHRHGMRGLAPAMSSHAESSQADMSSQADGLAGYAGMLFVPGHSGRGGAADVLTLGVLERYWGHGIGSALLGALVAEALRRGCGEVFLEVREDNPRARGLYLRRGFTEIGVRRGYYQPSNVNAIVMRKDLHASHE